MRIETEKLEDGFNEREREREREERVYSEFARGLNTVGEIMLTYWESEAYIPEYATQAPDWLREGLSRFSALAVAGVASLLVVSSCYFVEVPLPPPSLDMRLSD